MTDRIKNLAKKGWNPEKSTGSSGSGHSDSRLGQVKGWVGNKVHGKDSNAAAAQEHQSTPLSSLKDPSTFAPPPKRLDYNGGSVASASAASTGGSSSASQGSAKQRLQEREEAKRRAEEEASRPPTGPYRPDTTGLSTAHLPKPPAFRPNAATSSPSSPSKPAPRPPPRLPPRQNSNPDANAAPPPPTYNEATQQGSASQGMLNQGSLNRLGQAGISVPGFGIGRTASPPVPPRQMASPPVPFRESPSSNPTTPGTASAGNGPHMSELQNGFANLSTRSSGAAAPTAGTSWADKQAALRTATSLRDDPSKVSTSDLRGAAATANNFHQRHGDQVASSWKTASGLSQKYGIAGKVNNVASSSPSPTPPQSATQSMQGGIGKKAPPPPPPKKKELGGRAGEPPPIPLGSKPKF